MTLEDGEGRGNHTMEPTQEVVKQISSGNDAYNLMVFPDKDRWLWFVAFANTGFTDSAGWGRLLGCGDALDEKEAWKRARRFVGEHQKKN